MRRAISIIGLLILAALPAKAAGFASMGVGTATCERFLVQYGKDPRLAETIFFSWAQGFMSGMNQILLTQGSRTKDMQSLTLDDQKAWIVTYCRQKPTALYLSAVTNMWISFGNNPAVPRPKG
jgi:hypothetical protein